MATTIGGTAIGAPTSNLHVQNSGEGLLSMWADVTGLTDPNSLPQMFRQYGKGLMLRDVLYSKGMTRELPSNDLNVLEKVSDLRPIKTKSIIASGGGAGAAITIVLHSDNYESTKNPVQVNDVILIPAKYLSSGQNNSAGYFVSSRSTATLTNDTLVCNPLNVLSSIGTDIPAGTLLTVDYNAYARGTGQPTGKANIPVQKSYTWAICKATAGIEQDFLATKHTPIEYKGNRWYINEKTIECERELDRYQDNVLHHGQKNTNTSVLVEASGITGDDGVVRSCDGLTTILDTYGMCGYYDTEFGVSHLTAVTDGFIAQGVPTTTVGGYNGHTFWKNVSDLMRSYLASYSGGSDLYDGMKNKLGVSPDTLNYNGFDFYFQTLSTLSNPGNIGVSLDGEEIYEYGASCIFIPDNPITVNKFGNEVNASIPNVGVGTVNYNGENGGKVSAILKGVTNLAGGNAGTDKAGLFYYWLIEFMLFGGAWNQKYYMRKQK